MSEIFAICQTWLNIRQYRWQKHCKSWNTRKPLRSQTLLYNIGITQARSPLSKMNVRKFSVRAAITRHPKAHMRDSCQNPDHSEAFLPQLDSEHRGNDCKDGNRYRNFYQKWCFSKCQIIDTGIEPLNIWKLYKKIQRESIRREIVMPEVMSQRFDYKVCVCLENYNCLNILRFWKVQINWIIRQFL